MKTRNTMIKKLFQCVLCMLAMVSLGSCDDWFNITPKSEMVGEDFWKDKTDVQSAVSSCYRAMCESGFVKRLIVWGELRSDNVVPGPSSETDLTLVLNASIAPSNSYAGWGEVYQVINYCNTVIEKAPEVKPVDPNFSQAELDQYLAEASVIRAFCYFTLVRTFNNVPYIDKPYLDDTREYNVPQSSAEEILGKLIADLHQYEDKVVKVYNSNIVYTRGRVTQKALWALMADMYLWLQDYEHCVTYCDKILNENSTNPLSMVPASTYYNKVFFQGNSDESIWELEFDNNTHNGAVNDMYGSNNNDPKLCCSDLSELRGMDFMRVTNKVAHDYRGVHSYILSSGSYRIRKYVANLNLRGDLASIRANDFTWGNGYSNWIFYRLADAYLMKAEALVEMGRLDEAYKCVCKTYDRANPDLDEGTLEAPANQFDARNLVFDERQREFLFEGKRYFDLVRRMRREGSTSATVYEYLIQKYVLMSLDQNTVLSKINDIDAIYMPIHENEIKLNTSLVQNRFYERSTDIVKK